MTRPKWDFDYRPLVHLAPVEAERDFVVATNEEETAAKFLRAFQGKVRVDELLIRPPLFWYRVRLDQALAASVVHHTLSAEGIGVRYVTSSLRTSQALGARIDFGAAGASMPSAWGVRIARPHRDDVSPGRWFVAEEGVGVDRSVCGSGAGTRLAVVDDAAGDADALELDAEVLIGVSDAPRGSSHGGTMVAWAVGTRGRAAGGVGSFAGVAPDASVRLYVIPKPGRELLWLPLAIVRAVDDGADAVVCATNVEGTTSALLDDALEFAVTLGRGGLGTPVIMPTGREISSPHDSVHASLTLGFGDPASDPRVLCVAPSGRSGNWFLWADRSGKLRPFANRGPGIRVAAPGDDMEYPFAPGHRLGHAESSGASAIAAGVVLLVLATNPKLRLHELYELLATTAMPCGVAPDGPIADPADLMPSGRDEDGHDVKCGYGRLSAMKACLSAQDPIAAALVAMGEDRAAAHYVVLRKSRTLAAAYSNDLAAWAARVVREDDVVSHGLRAVLRHVRLIGFRPARQSEQTHGSMLRMLVLALRRLANHQAPVAVWAELDRLQQLLLEMNAAAHSAKAFENAALSVASMLWERQPGLDHDSETAAHEAPSRLAS